MHSIVRRTYRLQLLIWIKHSLFHSHLSITCILKLEKESCHINIMRIQCDVLYCNVWYNWKERIWNIGIVGMSILSLIEQSVQNACEIEQWIYLWTNIVDIFFNEDAFFYRICLCLDMDIWLKLCISITKWKEIKLNWSYCISPAKW